MKLSDTHRALLGRLLPDDEPGDLAVHRGQFHHVVIGSDRVVCLPRTEAAAGRLPERAAVLRALAVLDLGFRTPEPLSSEGGGHDADGMPFLVLSRVPGAPLEAGALDDPVVADAVAAQYASLLAGLARAGADEATVRAALPRAPEGRWRQFAADVRAELFPFMADSGRRRAERELAALDSLPHITDAVVHGDLGGENVLWEHADGLPRLSGVVDWDEVGLGDPAEDLAAVGASYGENFLGRVLLAARGSRSRPADGLSTRIAAIRGTFALQQALAGRLDGDDEELAEGLADYR
ncbi:viomycin phosphotransferase [Streptomyces roseifaciens]|uniref:viomycin phosphotransferase n=1 Tax=Streptomyces roseifaciens TaxID=1488406 RepID=UPI000718305F|nr:viomycin phosphotransferase [Streptomyces roseifaciens]